MTPAEYAASIKSARARQNAFAEAFNELLRKHEVEVEWFPGTFTSDAQVHFAGDGWYLDVEDFAVPGDDE